MSLPQYAIFVHSFHCRSLLGAWSRISQGQFSHIYFLKTSVDLKEKRLQNKLVSALALCPNMRIRLTKQVSNSTRLSGEMRAPSLQMMSRSVGLLQQASVKLQEERRSVLDNCLSKHHTLKAL